jgi:hypothetical protein
MTNESSPSPISSLPARQIIAALKAEDGTSQSAMTAAATAAEQRWPLLKSLTPEKWAIAPSLSETEKAHRNLVEQVETVVRKTSASAPNINVQLANALNRMNPAKVKPAEKKPIAKAIAIQAAEPLTTSPAPTVAAPVATPSPVMTPSPVTRASHAVPPSVPPSLSPSDSDSIQAILQRVEQAHQPVKSPRTKVPGFLARLGKR